MARLRDATPPLLVGKFVDVEIETEAPFEYFRIPGAALRPGNDVWTVDGGDTLRIVSVRVLQRVDDEALVTGELTAGQPVVVGGVEAAVEGMPVRSVPEDAP